MIKEPLIKFPVAKTRFSEMSYSARCAVNGSSHRQHRNNAERPQTQVLGGI